jgi:hypothetical protein
MHKGSTQTNKKIKLGFKKKGAKKPKCALVWHTGQCPVCHRTVSGAPGPYNSELATFGFLQRHFAIIHRTVRCAIWCTSGATASQRNGRLQWSPATLQCVDSSRRSQSSRQRRTGQCTVPVRCGTGLSSATRRQSLQRSSAPEP